MHSSYFNAKKVSEFSSACTSIARLRFISSVPAVLNLKFGTREAAAHCFFFFFFFVPGVENSIKSKILYVCKQKQRQ